MVDIAIMLIDFFDSQLLHQACRYEKRSVLPKPTEPVLNATPSTP